MVYAYGFPIFFFVTTPRWQAFFATKNQCEHLPTPFRFPHVCNVADEFHRSEKRLPPTHRNRTVAGPILLVIIDYYLYNYYDIWTASVFSIIVLTKTTRRALPASEKYRGNMRRLKNELFLLLRSHVNYFLVNRVIVAIGWRDDMLSSSRQRRCGENYEITIR